MKKILFVSLLLTVVIFVPPLSFAQEGAMMEEKGMAREHDMPMGDGMKMMHGKKDGMCPMCSQMMGSILKKQIVASGDGGVIVLAGNKLSKYDKDLNLVKEIELPDGMEDMGEAMTNMKKMCPMCQKKMMKPSADDSMMKGAEKK